MKAIIILIRLYLFGTRLQRWLMGLGLAVSMFGVSNLAGFGPRPGAGGMIAFSAIDLCSIALGLMGLLFGGALLPIIFGRLAIGHHLHVLPHGREKLLAGALLGILLVALFFAAIVTGAFAPYPVDHRAVFGKTVIVSFVTTSLVYGVIWFISRARSAFSILGGSMLVIGCLGLPLQFIELPGSPLAWVAVGTLALYALVITAFLCAPRLRGRRQSWTALHQRAIERSGSHYREGQEVGLMLGHSQPWVLAVGQAFPVLIATRFVTAPTLWLFYFALCSAISGAIASTAAGRCRNLWLRAPWTRQEIFAHVEYSFLKQNSYCVSVLLLLLVGIGSYQDFPIQMLVLGIPLLVIGTMASTWLGLMMTRTIGWSDSICAVLTMTLMMAAAIYAAGTSREWTLAIVLEAALAILAGGFRLSAIKRWSQLDWAFARTERHMGLPA